MDRILFEDQRDNNYADRADLALMKRLAEEMFGMPMQIPAYQEEAACGAALQTLASTGVTESLAEAQTRIRYL